MVVSPHPSLFLSDHCFIQCTLAIPFIAVEVKEVTYRRWKNIDLAGFGNDVLKLNDLPLNELLDNYDLYLRLTADKHALARHKVRVERPRVPWYSDDLRRLKTRRRKLERMMRKTRLPRDFVAYLELCISANGNSANRCGKHGYTLRFRHYGCAETHCLNSCIRQVYCVTESLLTIMFP